MLVSCFLPVKYFKVFSYQEKKQNEMSRLKLAENLLSEKSVENIPTSKSHEVFLYLKKYPLNLVVFAKQQD